MRNSKRNLHILSVVTFASSLVIIISGLKVAVSNPSQQNTSIESMVGSSDYSVGNSFGTIYSIDGKQISEIIEMNGKEKCVAVNGYSEIVGSESGLLINELRPLLLANNNEINRRYRKGDNVITTLHSDGMRVAHNMLAEYDSSVEASICVMARDGAVLVSAGNNSYDNLSFFEKQPPKDLFVDYNISNNRKGSAFKPLVYRMLLGHISELPNSMDFTSNNFFDVSEISVNGEIIRNWDYRYETNYDYSNGILIRKCSLANLLEFSSNTAPVRITKELGFEKAYTYMKDIFGLDKNIKTDINELSCVSSTTDRYPWFFFGQDASVSPLRMVQMQNFATSGEFVVPFYIAALQKPDEKIYYMSDPDSKDDYSIEIAVKDDILNNAMEDTFESESYLSDQVRNEFSQNILESRRILCKSGTAENSNGTENRVLMMTLLDQNRTNVIGTACICVNNTSYSIGNDVFVTKVLKVFEAIDML